MTPKIFLRDPWRVVVENDTGWGNRLICWDVAIRIREALGNTHEIVVLKPEFPELIHVNLPHTSLIDGPNALIDRYQNINKERYIKITNQDVESWFQNKKVDLDPTLSYETDFSFDLNSRLLNFFFKGKSNPYIEKISISDEKLKKSVSKFGSDKIGIHIRRGSGVHLTKKDLSTIPPQYQEYYLLCPECDKHYNFINDETIYNYIDELLDSNPNHKFYISIDVDEKAIEYYKIKYPEKIFTCSDFINKHKTIIQDTKLLNEIAGLKSIGKNILDFFILSNTNLILQSKHSTWSKLSQQISGTKTLTLEEI